MTDYEKILALTSELTEYALAMNDELGEYWAWLSQPSHTAYMSPSFQKAYENELLRNIKYVRKHCKITIREETIIRKTREVEFLD